VFGRRLKDDLANEGKIARTVVDSTN